MEADIFIPVQNMFVNKGCLSVHDSLYFKKSLRNEIMNELCQVLNVSGFKDFTLV